jgi:hypothetical protein
MGGYQLGGGLSLITVLGKTNAFAEFLESRMVHALETQDPAELHYLLAQLDDTILTCGATITSWRRTARNGWTQGSNVSATDWR